MENKICFVKASSFGFDLFRFIINDQWHFLCLKRGTFLLKSHVLIWKAEFPQIFGWILGMSRMRKDTKGLMKTSNWISVVWSLATRKENSCYCYRIWIHAFDLRCFFFSLLLNSSKTNETLIERKKNVMFPFHKKTVWLGILLGSMIINQ